jgi:hypothetical protein
VKAAHGAREAVMAVSLNLSCSRTPQVKDSRGRRHVFALHPGYLHPDGFRVFGCNGQVENVFRRWQLATTYNTYGASMSRPVLVGVETGLCGGKSKD